MNYQKSIRRAYLHALFVSILWSTHTFYGQDAVQLQKIKEDYRFSKINALTSKFKKEDITKSAQLINLAKANGWVLSETLSDGSFIELHDIGFDGKPIYYTTYGNSVGDVSRANTLHENGILNLGLNGEGMLVGVWDAGAALMTHREFDTRVASIDTPDIINSHATMVTGILVASGIKSKAQGVAYKAKAITNDWKRDKIEVAEAAANGLLLSNHSYGIKTDRVPDWYFGSYIKVSQDWDKIMYNAPYYLMVTAAGNAQKLRNNDTPIYGTVTDGYDVLLGFTTSKNGITVAAANTEIDNEGNLKNVSVTSYSSFGPIDDGRIKPDIAGAGTNIYSTNSNRSDAYDSFTGTSMATPGITGSMVLLQQYYERLHKSYMKAATLKGLVLHTADDIEQPGPDYKMGWGVMNSKRAAELITAKGYRSQILEETIVNDSTYSITVNATENEPLQVSISWTDPASEYVNRGVLNDATAALVNDLDIRMVKDGKTFYPWKLSAANASGAATKGDNLVDPFEKIAIENAIGSYTILVTHKGKLKTDEQNFTLIVSGVSVTECNTTIPMAIEIGESFDESIELNWKAMPDTLFELQYKEKNTLDWITLYTDSNAQKLEDLEMNADYEIRMRTICTANAMSAYSQIHTFSFLGIDTQPILSSDYETLNNERITFSVYPNPTTDTIKLKGDISKETKFRIVNTMGSTIKEGNVAIDTDIDVTQLSSGLYILTVLDFEDSGSVKFYKE